MNIIPYKEIPLAEDVPLDHLTKIFRVIVQMEQLCSELEGVGLSAVQVGIPWKLFIVLKNNVYHYYINCDYTGIGEKAKSIEGCLSLNNLRFEVDRYVSVKIKGKQLKVSNNPPSLVVENVDFVESGFNAVVMQHEIDHQKQILISDIGKEIEILKR